MIPTRIRTLARTLAASPDAGRAPLADVALLGRFIDLPYRLHANHPLWVPPLRLERRLFLSRRANAFFSHGEAQYLLARRDGRVAGRISAHINTAFNDYRGSRWGWFGFLEFEDDPEVLAALLDAAAQWLRERGMERMVTGEAEMSEIDLLLDVASQVEGHTICGLGDAAAWPIQGLFRHFRHEVEERINNYRVAKPHVRGSALIAAE